MEYYQVNTLCPLSELRRQIPEISEDQAEAVLTSALELSMKNSGMSISDTNKTIIEMQAEIDSVRETVHQTYQEVNKMLVCAERARTFMQNGKSASKASAASI